MQREWELNSSFEAQSWSRSRRTSNELNVPMIEAVSARNRYLNAYFRLNACGIKKYMSKLPSEYKFLDLSDYGRPIAKVIANSLRNTSVTPIQVTWWFVLAGLIGVYCILMGYEWGVLFFMFWKSTLDAADGELSRVKQTPSHRGRYLDSIADIALNFLFIMAICFATSGSYILGFIAWFGIQLQGTLYNYYYVILRNKVNGDTTSRIFEREPPTAFPSESQSAVNSYFKVYHTLYGIFDNLVYKLDPKAPTQGISPSWFMTCLSIYGLGFQLLLIGILYVLGLERYIVYTFIALTAVIPLFVMVRPKNGL